MSHEELVRAVSNVSVSNSGSEGVRERGRRKPKRVELLEREERSGEEEEAFAMKEVS